LAILIIHQQVTKAFIKMEQGGTKNLKKINVCRKILVAFLEAYGNNGGE